MSRSQLLKFEIDFMEESSIFEVGDFMEERSIFEFFEPYMVGIRT